MVIGKKKLALAGGLALLIISMLTSISTAFLILLIGLLLVPVLLVFSSIVIEGIPILSKELMDIFDSRKNFFVISASKESIILEPQFR